MKEQKNVMIMGDSYSTYGGYIPEGYNTYYSDERAAAPVVKGVEKTWWSLAAKEPNFIPPPEPNSKNSASRTTFIFSMLPSVISEPT